MVTECIRFVYGFYHVNVMMWIVSMCPAALYINKYI
nr:MAG TPA: hypothetical protein [Bacteriophage sp.]